MLTFDDIAQAVKVASHSLETTRGDAFRALQFYRHSGGKGPSWRTAGIYVDVTDEARLVLEALYLSKNALCVFRVYRDSPVVVSFAAKVALEVDSCRDIAERAVAEFGRALPSRLPEQFRVPREFGLGVSRAMLPIPPPVNLDAIP